MEFSWDARTPRANRRGTPKPPSGIKGNSYLLPADPVTYIHPRDYISYLDKHKVIICKVHAIGIRNLETHLRDYHSIPKKERELIRKEYSNVSIIELNKAQLPLPLEPPIKELGKPLDGFLCDQDHCGFITVNTTRLRQHYKKVHRVPWTKNTIALLQKVKVQTFSQTPGQQRYFIVKELDAPSEVVPPYEHREEIGRLVDEWKGTQKAHEEKAYIMDAQAAKTDRTGWFKRTGWLEHLAKRNRLHLAHAIRLPGRDEPKLQRAAKAVEALVERSVAGLATLARETRRWLRSTQQQEVDQRPMARLQNPESQARYAGYLVMFTCYFLRILADDEARAEDAVEEDSDDSSTSSTSRTSSSASSTSRTSGSASSTTSSSSTSITGRGRERRLDTMKDARELFCWQGRQKALATTFWHTLDSSDYAAQADALLKVLASFIFEPTSDQPFKSGLIHFLAVLGIHKEMDRLRTAKDYSYMLAGVVYCVRVLAVEALLPSAHRDKQNDEDRQRFLTMRQKFLADGSYSPMSEALSLLAYSKHIALNTGNTGNIYWSKDKTIFYLGGKPIFIRQFQQMAQDLVAEAEEKLWQELLWVARLEERFTTKLEGLIDDVTFTRRGMSFVHHRDNGLSDGLERMLSRALQCPQGRKLRLGLHQWHTKQVKRYVRQIDRFLELLLICVHMTSGQPGRGSEITTMRHRNGVLQDRNVFVMDGQVMTVVRYHKSLSQWDQPKVVPRFLPNRLSQVMVTYLAYVQPFREYLVVQVLGGSFSDYVWGDDHGPWGTDRLTRVLKRESGKRLGLELGTLDYRHTAVGIGRVVIGESFGRGYQDEVGEMEEAEVDDAADGESALELQNARTTKIGLGSYSVPIDIIKHLSVRSIETFRPLSERWHDFLGLTEQPNAMTARATTEILRVGASTIPNKRQHQHIDSSSGGGKLAGMAQKRRHKSPPATTSDGEEEKLKGAMQQALGQLEVAFKSAEQEQAIRAVVYGQTPLVVVLPTGGGKTLLITVPACLPNPGVTIVVVPYRALIEDLLARITQCRLDCIEWTYGQVNPAAIVVVSADVAGSSDFLNYAGMLSSKKLLRRIVVDECHLIFTSSDWRPKLAKLKHLRVLSCPMVLLTATLPPVLEEVLGSSMLVRCATYIRASTVRPNLRYLVSWCERGRAQSAALALCRRQQERLREGKKKGIIYCHTKAICVEMAEELDCAYYHAGVIDRAERLQAWLETGGFIVATSALGTGVDFEGIVCIVHVGMPWSMIDYAQESGRGGRAGELVDSVIVVERGEVERRLRREEGSVDIQAMGLFLQGTGCRRGCMSEYLDGRRVDCTDIESAGCDWCGEGVGEWQEAQVQASIGWQRVQETMDELRQGCAVCWVIGGASNLVGVDDWLQHRPMQCNAYRGMTGRELDEFRKEIRDGGDCHSCRRCWVSQKYCATGEKATNRCQWPNVVIPLARAALEIAQGVEAVRECGFQGDILQQGNEYKRWLGRRHRKRIWGEYFSNAMVVAIRIIEKRGQGG